MNFSTPFIFRPVATILLSIGLMLSGIVAYHFLPVAALPSVDIPTMVVLAARPGADPETMANSIAAPLERRLGEIPALPRSPRSHRSATPGSSCSSTSTATSTARRTMFRPRSTPPWPTAGRSADPAVLPQVQPADAPIMQIALSSDTLSTAQIYDAADTILAQRLSQAQGVAQVTVNGAEKPAVRIRLDPVRLAAAGLSGQNVYTAVRAANVLEPLGGFEGPQTAETIGINGQIWQASQYRPLIVKTTKGAILRLSDVASVVNATANTRLAAWDGKQPAILLTITKETGANVIDTADGLQRFAAATYALAAAGHPAFRHHRPHHHHPRKRGGHAVHVADHYRAGADGGADLHAPADPDAGRRGDGPAVDQRHARGHVVPGLHDRQLLADGADRVGGLRRR